MKESINYYYNLSIEKLEENKDIFYFVMNKEYYFLVPINRRINELEDIVNVSRELKLKGILVHDIIINKMGKIITNIYNNNYVLIHIIGDIFEEYEIDTIIKLNKSLTLNKNKSELYRNNWSKLWSDKVDYFEYQIRELGKNKEIILDSFSYYIGLAENAISYVNNISLRYNFSEYDKICLAHRRINVPNYKLNYFNPLSFIFDLEVRDIAEYIKSAFWNGEHALNYLKYALKLSNFTPYSLAHLYARLLYPTYYFDIYEKIMENEESEEALIKIIEKNHDYEIFLKEAFLEISKYAPIERVEWILKKEL